MKRDLLNLLYFFGRDPGREDFDAALPSVTSSRETKSLWRKKWNIDFKRIPVLFYFVRKDFCIVFFRQESTERESVGPPPVRLMCVQVGGKIFKNNLKGRIRTRYGPIRTRYGPDTIRIRTCTDRIRAWYGPGPTGYGPDTGLCRSNTGRIRSRKILAVPSNVF